MISLCIFILFLGVHNWSKLCVKLITICLNFTKDNDTCCEKWRFIYNDYKKKRWWISNLIWTYYKSIVGIKLLIIKFMYNHVNIIPNAHASAFNPKGIKPTHTSSKTTIKFEGKWMEHDTNFYKKYWLKWALLICMQVSILK